MEKPDLRLARKYCHLKVPTPNEIQAKLYSTLLEFVPSFLTVKTWAAEFKRHTQTLNARRSGRLKTVTIVGLNV